MPVRANIGSITNTVGVQGTVSTTGGTSGTVSVKGTPTFHLASGTVNVDNLGDMRGTIAQVTQVNSIQSGSVGLFLTPGQEPADQPGTRVTVTGSGTKVLAPNPNRRYAAFSNPSDSFSATLSFDDSPGSLRGIRLAASGGFYEITSLNLWRGSVTMILNSGGTADIGVVEFS